MSPTTACQLKPGDRVFVPVMQDSAMVVAVPEIRDHEVRVRIVLSSGARVELNNSQLLELPAAA
ncbi:MAG: hypothetical protein AB7L13_24225 [Acidimicrobiia bacterium]